MSALDAAGGRRLRVGITQRRRRCERSGREYDALDDTWPAWLAQVLPAASLVPIANDCDGFDAESIDALILSGGEDVGTSPLRDATERSALDRALVAHIPVIGVCRGMQFLHLQSGGTLVAVDNHVGSPHGVKLNDNTRVIVNSWHRWGIRDAHPDWVVLALADDSTVEAFVHRDRPWLGVMSHPERDGGDAVARWVRALLTRQPVPFE